VSGCRRSTKRRRGIIGVVSGYPPTHSIGQCALVPLIDVTFSERIKPDQLRTLGELLSEVVPRAVDCPEDPFVGPPAMGDLEIRFHRKGALDVGELSVVVEVRTKRFESRVQDAQQRAETIRRGLSTLSIGPIGVWLVLLDGAWTQD
jgi:hypothetical protein